MFVVAKTAGWMKTPLGTEVDLGPGHIVLDAVPALRETGTAAPPPSFRPVSIVATVGRLSYCFAIVYTQFDCDICGIDVAEKVGNQNVFYFPTSSN